MRERVIGIGAGGHAKVLIEIIQMRGEFELVGLLDPDPQSHGKLVSGVTVLGDDSMIPALIQQGVRHFFLGVGSVDSSAFRRQLFEKCIAAHMEPVSTVHPAAILSPVAGLGKGCMVMAGAILNPGVTLGENVIVNTGAVIDHDCVIESHVHVATGAALSGGVHVGTGSHIGTGAVVKHGVRIGMNVVVGAGAVVIRDVPDSVMVAGVPAETMRRL